MTQERSMVPFVAGPTVARDRELSEALALVRTTPLVTVTGAPGIGKTRLCAEVAVRAVDAFPDGVVWVELATARGGEPEPAAAVARALGLAGSIDAARAVTEHLRDGEMLLVLDGCEALAAPVAALTRSIRHHCRGTSVLVSSQVPLGLAGERRLRMGPLAEPDATELFWELAAAAGTTETPSAARDAETRRMAAIHARAGGVPAAIEELAQRAAATPVARLAAGVDGRVDEPTHDGGASAARPPRPGLLEAAIERSHRLLDEEARALLRRLAVFDGGFTTGAAEAVVGADTEVLGRLVDASLVERVTGWPDRYQLLAPVRAYALCRLNESGEHEEASHRHRSWFVGLACAAEPKLTSRGQVKVLAHLDAEAANLRAAVAHASAAKGSYDVLRLASALTMWWAIRGRFDEGRQTLEAALAHDPMPPLALRARMMLGLGYLAHLMGDITVARAATEAGNETFIMVNDSGGQARAAVISAHSRVLWGRPGNEESWLVETAPYAEAANDDWCVSHMAAVWAAVRIRRHDLAAARRFAEYAVAVARQSGDLDSLAFALESLASVAAASSDPRSAYALRTAALRAAATLGDPLGAARLLVSLGAAATANGDVALAETLLTSAVALARSVDAQRVVASALNALGETAMASDDLPRARALLEQALSAADQTGDTWVPALHTLARVCSAEGNLALASALLGEALGLARGADAGLTTAEILLDLADVCDAMGDDERAEALADEALDLLVSMGHRDGTARALETVAGLTAPRQADRAARLLGAAETLRGSRSAGRRAGTYDAAVGRARDQVGPDVFDAAVQQGRSLGRDDAIVLARRSRGARPSSSEGWAALTTAERDVAALVAEGLSNPEIATRLFVSRRTVENHVSHALAKLGLRSRVELAVEAVRRHDASK